MKPLCIDLFSGLGGWTEGFLAEDYDCIGVDIEHHEYGEHRYPADLVLQDVRTLHGSQFRDAAIIVASSPCQAYSYMAMPWARAKQIARAIRDGGEFPEGYVGPRMLAELNDLFVQPARIQREASEAAGRWIPMIQENVCGAQKWVGRARWHYGSYYLWGDVPALMPTTNPRTVMKEGVAHRANGSTNFHQGKYDDSVKNTGGSWFNVAHNTTSGHGQNPDGRKVGGGWFYGENDHPMRKGTSKGAARKAASARIAKIPFALASHIARTFKP